MSTYCRSSGVTFALTNTARTTLPVLQSLPSILYHYRVHHETNSEGTVLEKHEIINTEHAMHFHRTEQRDLKKQHSRF